MIFGRRRREVDAIADEILDNCVVEPDPVWFQRELKARVQKKCGSLIAMLLWTIISAVIQAAIKRWLERRAANA